MNGLRWLYLFLAIAGAVLTWYYNIQFITAADGVFDLHSFVAGGMANYAAASLSMDIFIAAVAGFIWIIVECRRLGMKNSWVYIILGGTIAFAFAFPFFLFMREGKVTEK